MSGELEALQRAAAALKTASPFEKIAAAAVVAECFLEWALVLEGRIKELEKNDAEMHRHRRVP